VTAGGRAALDALLAGYQGADQGERADLEAMRRHAATLADPFARAQLPAHFTGSAVVTDPAGQRVLLVRHALAGRWLQPGGHAEPGDGGSLESTALREAREETGRRVRPHPAAPRPLDVSVHRAPLRPGEPVHDHLDVRFLLVADAPDERDPGPGEAAPARWLAWDAATALVDEPELRRLFAKARAAAGASRP
jgi:8-oxo-dGTP pyrophosphatase MutT (NUDIX family)